MARLPWREKRGHWAKKVRENLRWGVGVWGSHLFGLNGHVQPNRVWFSEPWVINRVYNSTCILNRVSFWTRSLEQGVNMEVNTSTCVVWTSKNWKRSVLINTHFCMQVTQTSLRWPLGCCQSQWVFSKIIISILFDKKWCKTIKISILFDCWLQFKQKFKN